MPDTALKHTEHSFSCMSTQVDFKVFFRHGVGKVEANDLIEQASGEFFRISQKYTRFSEQSELSKLNASAGMAFQADDEFVSLVQTLLELAEFSEGAFDPTIIDLLEMHGYKASFNPKKIVSERQEVMNISRYARKRPSWENLYLDTEENTIQLAPKQRIDLGSIGKGYAIDLAATALKQGSDNFLISAGGDAYGYGQNLVNRSPWRIDLVSKKGGELYKLGCIDLNESGQALASSGSWARSAGKFHHLLNPKTGQPHTDTAQVFTLAESSMLADGLATVLFLTGKSYVDKLVDNYKTESLLVDNDYKIYSSNGFGILKC